MLTIKDSFPDLIIPVYFRLKESSDEWRLWHQDYEAGVNSIFDDKYVASRISEGRGKYDQVNIKSAFGKDDDVIIRTYKRGGLSALVLPDVFSDARRPLEELIITERGRQKGAPLPEILGLQIKWLTPLFYRARIIIKIIPETKTLEEFILALSEENDRQKLYQQKTALVASVAAALKALHSAGICHRDLNIRNILVKPAGLDFTTYIIDLDKSIYQTTPKQLSMDEKTGNLIRLNRSLEKMLFKTGQSFKSVISHADRLRLFELYFRDAGLTRAQKQIVINKCLKEAGFHKWWWKLIYPHLFI